MRSFNEYYGVSFEGMEEKEELQGHGIFPMGLVVDMEQLRELIGEGCPECGETSLVIDRIEFARHWDTVEGFHRGVDCDRILLGGVYAVVCGEKGCNFECKESIPVELFNRKPGRTRSLEGDEEIEEPPSPILIIEREPSPEEVEQIEKDDREYCEENDIEYDRDDLNTSIKFYL